MPQGSVAGTSQRESGKPPLVETTKKLTGNSGTASLPQIVLTFEPGQQIRVELLNGAEMLPGNSLIKALPAMRRAFQAARTVYYKELTRHVG